MVAAVVCDSGRYLVGLRPPEKRHALMWEFPGGKLLPGESDAVAITRELTEELDLKVAHMGALLFEARDPQSPFVIRFYEVANLGEERNVLVELAALVIQGLLERPQCHGERLI